MKLEKKKALEKIIEDWLTYHIDLYDYPSIAIGIADLEDRFTLSYGHYDKEKHIRADAHSLYNIASLSKIKTSIEILKLKDKAQIDLQDRVSRYIPEYPNQATTILNLLTHTAGLPLDGEFDFWESQRFPTYSELLSSLASLRTVESDHRYKYSNLGYAILGYILDKFNKVGSPNADLDKIVSYGNKLLEHQSKYVYIDTKAFYHALGNTNTISELTEFSQALLREDPSLLSLQSWHTLFEVVIQDISDGEDRTVAFSKWKSENIYDHSGHSFGFESYILLDQDRNFAITVLLNTTEEYASNIGRSIWKLIQFLDESEDLKESVINGLYRSKNYDGFVYDFGEKIMIFQPRFSQPFDNFEIFRKISDDKYLPLSQDDPYKDEHLVIQKLDDKVSSLKQGGWTLKKI